MGFRSDWQAAKDYADASKTAGNNNDPYQQVAKDYISAVQADAASKGKSVPRLSDFDKYMSSANKKTYDVSNKGKPQAAKSYGAQTAQYSGTAPERRQQFLVDAIRQANRSKGMDSSIIGQQQGQKTAQYLDSQRTNEFGVPLNSVSKNATDTYNTQTAGQDNAAFYATPQAANDYMQLSDADFYNKYGMNKYRYEELYKDNIDSTKALYGRYNTAKTSPVTSAVIGQQAGENMANYLDNASQQRDRLRTDAGGNTYVTGTPDTGDNGLGIGTDNPVSGFAKPTQQAQADPYQQQMQRDLANNPGTTIQDLLNREYLENRGQVTPYYQFLLQALEQQRLNEDSRYAFKDFQIR